LPKENPDKKSHEGSFFFTKEQTFMAVLYFVHVFAARRHLLYKKPAASAAITVSRYNRPGQKKQGFSSTVSSAWRSR
jgi:hypothetical protein